MTDVAAIRALLAHARLDLPEPVVVELAGVYPMLRQMIDAVSGGRTMADEPAVSFRVPEI